MHTRRMTGAKLVRAARAFAASDLGTAALGAVLVTLVLATYQSYGISNDEPVQQRYGELIVAYYASGFADQSLFHLANLYLYGGLFDVLAVASQHLLPFAEPYHVRHVLCALIGIAGIGASAAVARLIAGPRAGFIAALTLALCGPWYGTMFNHTKDIPFAAAMMGAAYFLLRAARAFPRPSRWDVICFGLLLGAALGVRVLGLLTVGYAALAVLIRVPSRSPIRTQLGFFAESALALTPAFLIAYVIMLVAWPWSALAPLNPLRGLIDFGEFHYQIKTLLAGHIYSMGDVPRWYVPVYLSIKLPLAMLVGAALAIGSLAFRGEPQRRQEIGLLAFIGFFPVICEAADRGPAFTGMRHFLFVVPVFAALAGIGLDWLLNALRPVHLRAAAGTALGAALAWNAVVLARLHPDEYLFFNPFVGGLQGAARQYDTDYWVNIMPEAVRDLETYVGKLDRSEPGRSYLVAVCGERLPFEKEANPRLRWTADWNKADFFIAPTHMNCDRALDGAIVANIERLGVPIGVVKDRRTLVRAEVASHR